MNSKYQSIADALEQSILGNTYPPGAMLPTEFQLCQQFQVSRQTIRMALKLLTDRGLIQRRQGCGSRVLEHTDVQPQSHRTVALITSSIRDYLIPTLLREAQAVLSAEGCIVRLYATSNHVHIERQLLLELLQEEQLDGILVEGTRSALPNPNLDLYRKLKEKGVHIVFFGANYENLNAVSILDDNYGGGRMLTEYLIGKKHRSIAGIFQADHIQGHQRFAGYSAALCKYGLPLEDSHVFWYQTEDLPLFSSDALWERILRDVLRGCTAVVCCNDEVASHVLHCLHTHGIRVPEQMAVVSFDNSPYCDLSSPTITSLGHEDAGVGDAAAHALLQLLRGERVRSQALPWVLSQRESS